MRLRHAATLAVAAIAVTAGGCGFGVGETSEGEVTLRVSEDFGRELLLEATLQDPAETDTVIGFLDEVAEIETSYGGNFVDSIEGREGTTTGGGDHDWLYFVNGMYAEIGGGEKRVHPGERIWWDYRYWYEAERIPIVVGSWPEPFKSGYDGKRPPVVLRCAGAGDACATVRAELERQGVGFAEEDESSPLEDPERMRILVGPWSELREDPAARQLEGETGESGVYATVLRCGADVELIVRGADGEPRQILREAGLIAAVRKGTDEPTLVVTGTGDEQVGAAAAELASESLLDRYAIAVVDGDPVPIPASDEVPPLDDAEGQACR